MNRPTSPNNAETAVPAWHWITLALTAQLGWGAYPALLRYLQTVSYLPSLSLLAAGNGLVLLLVLAFRWRHIEWSIFRLPLLWLFGGLVVLRGITNLLATRYTLAIYAQLIYLMTPFIVALLSRLVLHEQLPRHTFKALTLCLAGAVLLLSGNLEAAVSQATVPGLVSRNDWLGISLALASSFFLALYMLVTRRTTQHQASGESLLLMHITALTLFSSITSVLLQEDWQKWSQLQVKDWIVFGLFAMGVLLGANSVDSAVGCPVGKQHDGQPPCQCPTCRQHFIKRTTLLRVAVVGGCHCICHAYLVFKRRERPFKQCPQVAKL